MIHACRIAMAVGLISTGLAVIIGVFVGGFMGYSSASLTCWHALVEIFGLISTICLLLAFVSLFERQHLHHHGHHRRHQLGGNYACRAES